MLTCLFNSQAPHQVLKTNSDTVEPRARGICSWSRLCHRSHRMVSNLRVSTAPASPPVILPHLPPADICIVIVTFTFIRPKTSFFSICRDFNIIPFHILFLRSYSVLFLIIETRVQNQHTCEDLASGSLWLCPSGHHGSLLVDSCVKRLTGVMHFKYIGICVF